MSIYEIRTRTLRDPTREHKLELYRALDRAGKLWEGWPAELGRPPGPLRKPCIEVVEMEHPDYGGERPLVLRFVDQDRAPAGVRWTRAERCRRKHGVEVDPERLDWVPPPSWAFYPIPWSQSWSRRDLARWRRELRWTYGLLAPQHPWIILLRERWEAEELAKCVCVPVGEEHPSEYICSSRAHMPGTWGSVSVDYEGASELVAFDDPYGSGS